MKSVNEIKQEYAEFWSTSINDAVATNRAICALYRHELTALRDALEVEKNEQ